VIVVEPIKLKELSNDVRDKENISIYHKYFKNIMAVRSKEDHLSFFINVNYRNG